MTTYEFITILLLLLNHTIYIYIILILTIKFKLYKTPQIKASNSNNFVSIIIALRNEKNNIISNIESIISTNKDYNNYELIIVDDHSTDNSLELINSYKTPYNNINLFSLPDNLYGKKQAIKYAVSKSKGNILLFTDADCIVPNNWIKYMLQDFESTSCDMLCAGVDFINKKTLFSKLMQLEFMSLIGIAASSIFLKKPIMCNGANYMIYKHVYQKCSGNIQLNYSSGDDVFILETAAKNNYKIGFSKNKNTIVKTQAPENIIDFFKQRIRWASKAKAYSNYFSIITSITTFICSFGIILSAILSCYNILFLKVLIILFASKFIVDNIFLFPIANFFSKKPLIAYSLLLSIFYPFYICTSAVMSLFYKPKWKGRKIN